MNAKSTQTDKEPTVRRGRPEIVDEFSHLPVSRQRKWQLRQMAKGGCRICGQTAISGGYCLKHLVHEREYCAERFGCKRENLNCKSRLMEKQMETQSARWEA